MHYPKGSLKNNLKMKKETKKDTSKETFLIESLKKVVDGIAETFGSRCEVVLHDLRNLKDLERSIIKIENGYITGRAVGGSITDQGLKFLRDGTDIDTIINYPSVTKDGKPLKSSTIIFRNDKKKPIASICINFDLSDIMAFNVAVQDIFKVSEQQKVQDGGVETFQNGIVSTLDEIAIEGIRKAGKAVSSMGRKDKIELIRQLEKKGFFLIKGSVKLIASKLNLSKFTIYNYLEQVRSNQQDTN